jgi:hypothetical protein
VHACVEGVLSIDIRQLRRSGMIDRRATAVRIRSGGAAETTVRLTRRTHGQLNGGTRLYFVCPGCQRNCEQLCATLRRIECRICAQLWYAGQNFSASQRTTNRICKLRKALGGSGDMAVGPMPAKPKWMKRSKYRRKVAQIEALEERHITYLAPVLERLLAKHPPKR